MGSGDMTITGNSTANFTGAAVRVALKGTTGMFVETSIVGNQINSAPSATAGVLLGGANAGNSIRAITVEGNVFANIGGPAIWANSMTGLTIGPNQLENVGSPAVLLGNGTSVTGGLVGVSVAPQDIRQDGIDLIQDWRSFNNSNRNLDGVIAHRYRRHAYLDTAGVGVWQTQFIVKPWAAGGSLGSAGRMKFKVGGYNGSGGPFAAIFERLWAQTNASAVPTLTTVGTDATAGAGLLDVQFVLAASTITVQVQIKAAASVAQGYLICDLELAGPVLSVHKGA